MKKTLLLLGLSAIMSSQGFAKTYESPAMRGEITSVITSNHTNLLTTPIKSLPTPSVSISHVQTIDTVLIPANRSGKTLIDVTLLDEFIDDVSPNARHYPPNFPNATSKHTAEQNIKHLSDWIEPYASASDASFDVVLRAVKLNSMARNLNIGTDYAVRALKHIQKAIKMKPQDAETNFMFGMMLAETGAFTDGKKYLEKAASLGYLEAEQSLAQADLLSDNKPAAVRRLKQLQAKHPLNEQITKQVNIVENGGYYIWTIPDNDLSIKPYQ
ncbi:hypothetical protein LU293_00965 [Moraxella nasovis]|uniref:tetratricopeptide repeat protein n=1 Tax=Moraxella nasovis TaxID=2904121 RepID=UPI001F603359|nr:hypothetical protein [Moraxella nasovis]UNU73517.1 hypothetical protein LU293_00965 [Moraxella nasovis]